MLQLSQIKLTVCSNSILDTVCVNAILTRYFLYRIPPDTQMDTKLVIPKMIAPAGLKTTKFPFSLGRS